MSFLAGGFSALGASFTAQRPQKLSQLRKPIPLGDPYLLPAPWVSLYAPIHRLFGAEQPTALCCDPVVFLPLWGRYFSGILHRVAPHPLPLHNKNARSRKREPPRSAHWGVEYYSFF